VVGPRDGSVRAFQGLPVRLLSPPNPFRTRDLQTLLIIAELMIAVALIIFVLLQRSEGGALGMGGGGSGLGGLFSPRGAADTLTRTTAILAILFFLTCLGLNLLSLKGRDEHSILDSPLNSTIPASAPPRPALPARAPQVPSVPLPH
jgi:preprotein translocase subunit SecG